MGLSTSFAPELVERPTFDPNELNRKRTLQAEKIRQQTAIALSGLGPTGQETLLTRRQN